MSERFPFGAFSGDEPLPVVSLILVDDRGRVTLPLSAIVDTGANGTIVPFSILRDAGFIPGRQRRRLVSALREPAEEIVAGYLLTLRIGALEWPDIEGHGSRAIPDVILGRNVLNQWVFTYDGPRRMLELLDQ